MRWVTVRVVPAGAPDIVANFLFSEGAACVQEDAGALITSFPESVRLDEFRSGILSLDPRAEVTLGEPAEFAGSLHGTVAKEEVVADLGAGSAVLSIAAAKLGAARVAAIELDEAAISNAEENVAANGVEQIVNVIQGDAATLLPLLSPVNVVLANIVSGAVLELLPVIRLSLSVPGVAILSGILSDERPRMLDAFRDGGWSLEKEDYEEEWWSALIVPR